MDEVAKNDFNLNISRPISTAVGEAEISLEKTPAGLVGMEERLEAATAKHQAFLQELDLAPRP